MTIDLTKAKEVPLMATHKQRTYFIMLLNALVGEKNRKKFMFNYFGKKSSKDFDFDEMKLAIELCLNHKELLLEYFNKMMYDEN